MRIFTTCILLFLAHIPLHSQHYLNDEELQYVLCLEGYTNYQSTINATFYINKILNDIGIPDANFVLKPCRYINNATAIIYKGKRYILYDDIFMNYLAKPGNNNYYINLFILAHEIGHHLNGHTLETYKMSVQLRQKLELDADEFAGFIVAKNNGSQNDIMQALKALPHSSDNNQSHPTYKRRYEAAIKGFNRQAAEEKRIVGKHERSVLRKYEEAIKDHYIKQITSQYNDFLYTKNLAKARVETVNFQLNGQTSHLESAVQFYLQASSSKQDLTVISELAQVYWELGDYSNAQLFFHKAYEQSKDPTFLIFYWSIYNEQGTIKKDYKAVLEKEIKIIDYKNVVDYTALKALGRFYSLEGRKERNEDNVAVKQAIGILNHIVSDSLFIVPGWSNLNKMNLADVYSDLSINYNTIGNYRMSYENIVESADIYQDLEQNSGLDDIGMDNYLKVIQNKALVEMRLNKWDSVLQTTEKLHARGFETSDTHYFKGRALAAKGQHQEAVNEYTKALKISPNENYLYFYRGISNIKFDKTFNQGIIDLNTACSGGISPACEAIKIFTK